MLEKDQGQLPLQEATDAISRVVRRANELQDPELFESIDLLLGELTLIQQKLGIAAIAALARDADPEVRATAAINMDSVARADKHAAIELWTELLTDRSVAGEALESLDAAEGNQLVNADEAAVLRQSCIYYNS